MGKARFIAAEELEQLRNLQAPKGVRNRTGDKSGRLIVVCYAGKHDGRHYWACRCENDGNIVLVDGDHLNGHTRSCGCYLKQRMTETFRTHGKTGSPIYAVWNSMLRRCYNKDCADYKNYGARGIQVCERMKKFPGFYATMGDLPQDREIDRENTNGHYSCGCCEQCVANNWPANCRWVTRLVNARNKRNKRLIEFRGEQKTMAEWAELLGVSRDQIKLRLKRGWSVEETLTTPTERVTSLTLNGVTKTIAEWAKEVGCTRGGIINRLEKGWPLEKALGTPVRKQKQYQRRSPAATFAST